MQQIDNTEFLQASEDLIQFYRQYPEIAAYDLLGVELHDIQKVVLRAMWTKSYVMSIMSRGSGKTFLNALFACLKAMLYPGYRIGLLAPTFRQCVVGDTLISTDKGFQYVNEIKDPPAAILSREGFSTCSRVFTNAAERTIRIRTNLGFEIEGAPDHRLLVLDTKGTLVYRELSYLTSADEICFHKGQKVFGSDTDLDKFVPLTPLLGNTRDCFIPEKLDQELSYFLGLLTGDGCLTSENYIIFTNGDPEVLKAYDALTVQYFGKGPTYIEKGNHYDLVKGSKKFFGFLVAIGLGRKTAIEKSIPSIILQASQENVCSYLQGLFDTDGGAYFYPHTSHPCKVGFYNTSKKLIREVQLLLLNLGIVSSLFENPHQRKNPLYSLEIGDKGSLLAFGELIGFRSASKIKALHQCLDYIKTTDLSRRHFPVIRNINLLAEEACTALRQTKKGYGHLNLWKHFTKKGKVRQNHNLTVGFLQKFVACCRKKQISSPVIEAIETLISGDVLFDVVASKDYGFDYTYDFSVDKTHNYISNGMVSHNSKMVFDECTNIWQKSPILQDATERKPTQQSDNCYIRFKAVGGRNPSIIQGIPLGDGCLADGLILLNDRLVLIQDLLPEPYVPSKEEHLQNVSVWGENKAFSPVEYVWSNGETNNLRVRTHRRYSVEGTPNHPVRVLRGEEIVWSRLDSLKLGDYIVIDRTPAWHSGSSEITQEEAYVAGLLVGDGNYTNQYYIGFATGDPELWQRLNTFFKANYGKELSPNKDLMHYRLSGKQIRADFLSRLGISDLYTKDKYFPSEILKAEKHKMSAFIQGLFDTDGGFVVGSIKGGGCVSFYNTSSRLVKDLQSILLLYGIVSSVSLRSSRKENWADSYQLMITGNDVSLFYKQLGFGLERKQRELEAFVLGRQRKVSLSDGIPQAKTLIADLIKRHNVRGLRKLDLNTRHLEQHYKNGVPGHRVRIFVEHCIRQGIRDKDLDLLISLVEKNYFYDRVVSIENTRAETYDIYVPKDHTFWSNGFISHNTKIRGSRFYTILCDEFPHIPEEIFNMVIRPMAATVSDPMENVRRIKLQKELLEKGLITQDEIDESKLASNQIIITSSGYFTFNHMYKLYCSYRDEMNRGNQKYAVYRVPHWLLPDGFLEKDNIAAAKKQMSSLEFRMEYEAAFIPDTDAFYKASLLEACSKTAFTTQVVGTVGKSYVLGVDPARSEDSFAIAIGELGVPGKIVHAIEVQKLPFPRMSEMIEDLCEIFNVSYIYMDAGGGGLAIKDILAENNRNNPKGPILDPEDEVHQTKKGRHILKMCNFTVDFISESNFAALRLLEHHDLLFPNISLKEDPSPLEEESWQTIQVMKNQMQTIELTETPTGKHHFDVPKGEGHGKQKKDLYTSFMLAARAIYDHLWSEQLPENILHHVGVVQSRDKKNPITFIGDPSLGASTMSIPDALRDKLEIATNPDAFKRKMLQNLQHPRKILTSPAAVLKPVPKKKK